MSSGFYFYARVSAISSKVVNSPESLRVAPKAALLKLEPTALPI
jgi:hypothetical protein